MFKAAILACVVLAASTAHAGQNVVVVLDDSGSMRDWMSGTAQMAKMDAAKAALLTVLNQVPEEANVGVLLLNGRSMSGNWAYPLGPIDREALKTAVQRINADAGTPLGERIKDGADALLQARAKDHYGTYRLLVVTDGEATDGNLLDQHLPDILSRGIRVDVIGVDMPGNHSLATKVHNYRKADDPESLREAITEVFAESTGGGDADESDFEIIAAIPDELAGEALLALSTSGNDPIQPREQAFSEYAVYENAMPGGGATSGGGAPVADGDSGGMGTFVIGCLAIVLFIFWIAGSLKKSRRRY